MSGTRISIKPTLTRSLLWIAFVFAVVPLSLASEVSTTPNSSDTSQTLPDSVANSEFEEWLLTSRIIGGRDAPSDSGSSVVALVATGIASVQNRFFCGATVIAEQWVMTAAHCVFNSFGQRVRPSQLRVIAGIRNLENDVPEEELVVTNIFVHPQYNNGLDLPPFDIAVLELGSVINAPAVNLFAGDPAIYDGVMGDILGWGATEFIDESNSTFPSQLQRGSVPIVPLARCNSPVSYQGLVSHRQVCAGFVVGGVDSCVGDSGGPLFVTQDGEEVQVGITSFGNGCALPNFFGIYTSVSHFLPWLSNFIDVPVQTPEFIALLDSGVTSLEPESDNDSGGGWFGAIHPLSGFVLVIYGFIRWYRLTKLRAGSN